MTIPSPRYISPLLMLLAVVLRIVAIAAHPISHSLYNDMDNYRNIADAVLRGEWVPGHFLPAIGFSLVVAALKLLADDWVTAVGIYHLVISTATVWLVWKAAERGFGQRVGLLALLVGRRTVSRGSCSPR